MVVPKPAMMQEAATTWDMLFVNALLLACTLFMLSGCTRACYRTQADNDAYGLIRSKTCKPLWPLENYTIEPALESRMFDPDCPDCPPMPPDDPAAHKLMHCVDGKAGFPCWHAHGDTPHVENPSWLATLPKDAQGRVELSEASAVYLALVHSPTYQRQLEELFLSALDVSFERFRFDTQFFGGLSTTYTADGRARRGAGGESRSVLDVSTFPPGTNISARKLFAGGGEMVVGLANSLMWQFSGPDTHSATTLLDFSFIQPLLRAGGRDRILERLTIAERGLLGNVRQMERYRQAFYTEIVTGRFAGQGPSRRGGFFGGTGLEGFSGVGGGGFGRVGFFGGFFGTNNQPFNPTAGAGQAGGYLGLLQTQQAIRNQRSTIAALRSSVAQLESFFRAGRIDYFQVELARQALFNAQSQLLNAEQIYQATLDQFKIALGLPPHIPVVIDDAWIRPFQLIDTDLVDLQNEITELQEETGKRLVSMLELHDPKDGKPTQEQGPKQAATTNVAPHRPGLIRDIQLVNQEVEQLPDRWSPAVRQGLDDLRRTLEHVERIKATMDQKWLQRVRRDVEQLRTSIASRLATNKRLRDVVYPRLLESLSDGQSVRHAESPDDPSQGKLASPGEVLPIDEQRLRALPDQLLETLQDIEQEFTQLEREAGKIRRAIQSVERDGNRLAPEVLRRRLRDEILLPTPNLLSRLAANVLSLTLVQARARTESVMVSPIDLTWQVALETARQLRLDWMNARANLVDAWRLIQFNSDALQSRLDLVFHGDVGNTGDNPLRLRSSTGRLRVGLQFEAPITRLAERNQYRQALIEYQQARRAYYQFEDQIAADLRATLRALDVNQLNFEFRRVSVEVAIAQVELTRLRLQEPPRPEVETQFGATTARDLVSALADLLTVQNDFLSVWVNQESLRRALDLNMGTMQLDPRGRWLDPGPILDSPLPENCLWEIIPPEKAADLHPAPRPAPRRQGPQPHGKTPERLPAPKSDSAKTTQADFSHRAGLTILPVTYIEGQASLSRDFAQQRLHRLPNP